MIIATIAKGLSIPHVKLSKKESDAAKADLHAEKKQQEIDRKIELFENADSELL